MHQGLANDRTFLRTLSRAFPAFTHGDALLPVANVQQCSSDIEARVGARGAESTELVPLSFLVHRTPYATVLSTAACRLSDAVRNA